MSRNNAALILPLSGVDADKDYYILYPALKLGNIMPKKFRGHSCYPPEPHREKMFRGTCDSGVNPMRKQYPGRLEEIFDKLTNDEILLIRSYGGLNYATGPTVDEATRLKLALEYILRQRNINPERFNRS